MLNAARAQSLSVLMTSAADLKPSGNSTVIGPAASRTTCQLLMTSPNWPRASISVPLPYEMPSRSGTTTRATAGSAEGVAGRPEGVGNRELAVGETGLLAGCPLT